MVICVFHQAPNKKAANATFFAVIEICELLGESKPQAYAVAPASRVVVEAARNPTVPRGVVPAAAT